MEKRTKRKSANVPAVTDNISAPIIPMAQDAIIMIDRDLRESRERYRDLVELSPDMIVVHSEGKIVYINPAGVGFLGATNPQQLIGRPLLDLVHPDFRQTLAARLEPIYSGRERRSQIETRFVRLDGQVMDMEVSSVPITYEGKAARQVIARDISERKRAEERLVYQSQLLAKVHDAIIATDEHFTLTEWNRAAEQMYGWKAEEAIGRKVNEVIPTEFTKAQLAEALQLLSETGHYRVEVAQYRRDGKPIDVEGTTMALHDANGHTSGYVSVNRDITERKRAEVALRESERIRRLVLDNVDEIVYLVEMGADNMFTNQVRFVSGRVEQILGYQAEEFIHDRDLWFRIIHPDDVPALAESTRAIFASRQPGLREYRMRHKRTGDYHWLEDRVVPQLGAAGVVIGQFGVARDVTARVRAEKALSEAEQHLHMVVINVPVILFALDQQGKFTISEGKGLKTLGLKPGEVVGQSVFEMYADNPRILEHVRRALSGEECAYIAEGQGFAFDTRYYPVRDPDGQVIGISGVAIDVTERLQAEAALRESEERYRLLVELSPMAIFVHSHGVLLFANAVGATMLGATHPDELMGKSLLDFIHTDHRHEWAMRTEQIEQAGKPRHQEETMFVAADAQTLYAEVSAASITYRGQAARLAIIMDITERRQAEKELAERSQLLEAYFANTLTSIVLLDRDFNFIRVNEAYARAGARDVSDFPGHNHFEFYPSAAQAIFEDVVRTRKPFQTYARPFAFPDHPDWGTTYWDWTLVPILDNAGEVEFLVFTLNDVSERVKAEAERQKLASAVEQTDIGVMIVNRQGVIEFVNGALERIAGHSRQDLLGQTPSMLQSGAHSKEFYAGLWGTINAGETFHSVFTDKTNEGKHVHVDQTISPIKDAQGNVTHFVSVWKDITEQVQAEKERERLFEQAQAGRERLRNLSQQLLEVQETERRHIARELHDEIGQVLTAVRVNLQTIQLSPDPSTLNTRLEESISIVERALRQVRDLSLDLRPSLLDDFGLVPALEWYVDRQAERSGFTAEFVAEPPEIQLSSVLETACFRVAQAALTNVTRHARAKRVRVELHCTETELRLVVRDDGIGFDVDTVLEHAAQGASFGLLGMRERAQLAGGQIEIESAPMNGTEIRVRFPLLPSAEDGSSEGA